MKLSSYVNGAGILASDTPAVVVEKLQAAIDAALAVDRDHIAAERRSREAGAWRTLMAAAGSFQDGSETTVKLWQDDATRTCGITTNPGRPNEKDFYVERGTFEAAINQLSNYLAE
jgi:hypothetical protein